MVLIINYKDNFLIYSIFFKYEISYNFNILFDYLFNILYKIS